MTNGTSRQTAFKYPRRGMGRKFAAKHSDTLFSFRSHLSSRLAGARMVRGRTPPQVAMGKFIAPSTCDKFSPGTATTQVPWSVTSSSGVSSGNHGECDVLARELHGTVLDNLDDSDAEDTVRIKETSEAPHEQLGKERDDEVPAAQNDPAVSYPDAQPREETVVMSQSGGAQFDLLQDRWMSAIEKETTLDLLQEEMGAELNEMTSGKAVQKMTSMAKSMHAKSDSVAEANLTPHEQAECKRLKAAVDDKGLFDTRSYLGNQFRKFLDATPEEKAKYKECGNRQQQQATFRAAWAESLSNISQRGRCRRQLGARRT